MAWKTVLHLAWYLLLTPENTSTLRKEMSSVNLLRKCYLFPYYFLFTSKGQKFALFCKTSTTFLSGVFESVVLGPPASETLRQNAVMQNLGPQSQPIYSELLAGGSQYSPSPFFKQAPQVVGAEAYQNLPPQAIYTSSGLPHNSPPSTSLLLCASCLIHFAYIHIILNFLLFRTSNFNILIYLL